MTDAPAYTADELTEFNRLVENTESRDQVTRIVGRLKLRQFVETHGKPKCDVMYHEICRRQVARK